VGEVADAVGQERARLAALIIECASLDEAVEIAARHPAAASGAIEVRPLWQE
jgi:hypothetical protein